MESKCGERRGWTPSHFLCEFTKPCTIQYNTNSDFKSKMGLLSRVGHNRNNLKAFSHHFCITIFRYSANSDLGVTQFGAISAKKNACRWLISVIIASRTHQ